MAARRAAPAAPADFFSREFLERHIADIVAFYEGRVMDKTGGFHQNFLADGTLFDPGFKHIVSSARMVINFMLAGKVLGRKELLAIGHHGIAYLERGHWVAARGMYAFTMRDHQPEDMTQQAYGYAFVLAAHAAALLAGAAEDDAALAKVFDLLEQRFWLPEAGAYADTLGADGVLSDYRGQNANMHICEAMVAAYEATGDERYFRRAEVLASTFARRLAAKAGGLVWEHYTPDWEVDWEYNREDPKSLYRPWGFQPGHQMEWAKNLLNIHRHAPQAWMPQRARELFDAAFEASWDREFGGLVYGLHPDGGWCDDDKYFWVQAESIAAAALLFQATGDAKYRDRYDALWEYSWRHMVDHEDGAWLGLKLTRENRRCSEEKARAGAKCDYHSLASCVEALRALA